MIENGKYTENEQNIDKVTYGTLHGYNEWFLTIPSGADRYRACFDSACYYRAIFLQMQVHADVLVPPLFDIHGLVA